MLGKVAAFEFSYQTRQPVFWVGVVIFGLLTFGLTATDAVQISDTSAVHRNAPFTLVIAHGLFATFYLFVLTAFVANVVVRDDETGFGPIVRATPLSKLDYLLGRFAGAFGAALLGFAVVPLVALIGSFAPWLDPETVGPLRLQDYLYAYGVLAAPSLFFVGALLFAIATVTRSMMATFIGLIVVLILYFVASGLGDREELRQLMAYLDPFGIAAIGRATEYWTTAERNTRLPPLVGPLLANRALVIALGLAVLTAAVALFRPGPVGRRSERKQRRAKAVEDAPRPATVAPTAPVSGRGGGWAQLWRQVRFEVGLTLRSPAFFILIALFALFSGWQLSIASEPFYGARVYPLTRIMIERLEGTFALGPLIIAIFYAGELVWRERDSRVHEIVGSAPFSDWALVLPKALALMLVLFAAHLAGMLTAIGVQAFRGYLDFELDKYFAWWLWPRTVDAVILAALAIFVQVVSPHKFVGWLVMVVYVIATLTLSEIGLEHNLLLYGGGPVVPLSDMFGTGSAGEARAWFQTYWGAFALALIVLAFALWTRGTPLGWRARLARAPRRLRGGAGVVLAGAAVVAVAAGGVIFLNTNVWNTFRTDDQEERWTADYEKRLLRFERQPQPRIVDVRLNVDLRPGRQDVLTEGAYTLENRTGQTLKRLHVRFDRDLDVLGLSVDGARPERTFSRFNYRIFAFDTPMSPGERRRMTFTTRRHQRGFQNDGTNRSQVLDNGTFLNNNAIAPMVGMSRDGLLRDRAKRRKYGLPRELRPPKLDDQAARAFHILRRDSDWVTADITVSTDADQTPIAPGYRVADRTENGRRTVRFRTEAPIMNFFSIQSARYATAPGTSGEVALSVLHHPGHPWQTRRMLTAMDRSLTLMSQAFSPYQFRQLRIIEFPGGSFAQSFANTVPFSENLGFIMDTRGLEKDRSRIDMATYVTAHEIGHQWWGHQLIGADMQGASLLVETLAQYSALRVMEETYGSEQIRRFLKYELDRYLRGRGSEGIEELPLIRVEDQGYIHYRKGSLVMYRLKEAMGADAVDRALRRLLSAYAFKAAPYPTSRELIAALRAEAGPEHQALITDLFERITLYDVKTDSVTSRRRADGRFDVDVVVTAEKLYADGQGVETKAAMDEVVDVGLFTEKPGGKAFGREDVIVVEPRTVRSGRQTLRFVTTRAPAWGGADPYNVLIDRNGDDNVAAVD